MNRKRCWVCGAGDFTSRLFVPRRDDMVVAADGGLARLKELRILPQHILGDFDSLGYRPEGGNVAAYPAEKDDTDMLLAAKYGLEHGYDTFVFYGGLGGRLSHTIANLQLLRYLCERGCHGFLVDGNSIVTMLRNERMTISASGAGVLSVFAQGGEAGGVTIRNLKYTVEDTRLSPGYALGVSNEFVGEEAEIAVKDGALLIVWEDGASDFQKMHFQKF